MKKFKPEYIAIASAVGFTILAYKLSEAMKKLANLNLDNLKL